MSETILDVIQVRNDHQLLENLIEDVDEEQIKQKFVAIASLFINKASIYHESLESTLDYNVHGDFLVENLSLALLVNDHLKERIAVFAL